MAQLSDDCFAFGGTLMSGAEALRLVEARTLPLPEAETAPLAATLHRILAAPVVAPRSVPPHDNSAVDGYAVRYDDLSAVKETTLKIVGRAAAGHPVDVALPPKAAVRIFTGAKMPDGADTVMMQEDSTAAALGFDSRDIRVGID